MIRIRRADIGDLYAVSAIENKCFDRPWSSDLIEKDLRSGDSCYWVTYEDNDPKAVIGFLSAQDIAGEVNLMQVAVDPEKRRLGAASLMISTLIEHFEAPGVIGVTLEVSADNFAAIALYEAAGFKTEGVRKHYYGSGKDARIMWKRYAES